MKTNDMDVINMMPMFQVLNGWFGVFMFIFLGVWSKRFRVGVHSKAEEEKRKRAASLAYAPDPQGESPRTAETSPMTSRPASPQGSITEGGEPPAGSRPASGEPRPGSSTSQPPGSRPASGQPGSQPGSRPGSSTSQAPPAGSRPGSGTSQPPAEDPIPEEPEENAADAE